MPTPTEILTQDNWVDPLTGDKYFGPKSAVTAHFTLRDSHYFPFYQVRLAKRPYSHALRWWSPSGCYVAHQSRFINIGIHQIGSTLEFFEWSLRPPHLIGVR